MVRRLRWTLVAAGVLGLLGGGASIFSQPEYETLYGPEPPQVTCIAPAHCIAIYTLNVGNSGSKEQENVSIGLRSAALANVILPPKVANFGVNPRSVRVREEAGVQTYELGRLKPRDRVRMTFTLRSASRDAAPAWSDLLAEVRAAEGDVKAGDAALVSAGRVFFSLTGIGKAFF